MTGSGARADWEARIGRPSDRATAVVVPQLDPPSGLRAIAGRGQVTLHWDPVEGAAGYLVLRSPDPTGPFEPVDTGWSDVIPVPRSPFTDTSVVPGEEVHYAVASAASVDALPSEHGAPVAAVALLDGDATVRVEVDARSVVSTLHRPWRPMIGAERLSQLNEGIGSGDRHIGDEFHEALRLVHAELGVRAVRAHAILHDDLGVYREVDGVPVYDFSGIDRVYDRILELGLHPVVEVSFMPRDLARDPSKTVFTYSAIVSPPHHWQAWSDLVSELTSHLVDRYGREEVRGWGFEVWNEPNLEVFWSGTREEYLHLYEVTARAVKAVDAELTVGGPASAAAGWVDDLLAHAVETGAPIDFLSTHTYGNEPLDLRPIAARYRRDDLELWWTEWGVHAGHFDPLHDSVYAAAFCARGMRSSMGRLDALAYWVVSDHFEELGRPSSLFHGGFGLLSVGNLRKPRYWALWMLEQLGDQELATTVTGDGAGGMVDSVATLDGTGRLSVVVWNGSLDHRNADGNPLLDRRVDLKVHGLADGSYLFRCRGIDEHHSNLPARWKDVSAGKPWPDEHQWADLHAADRLEDLEPPRAMETDGGKIALAFQLPMPSVSLLELTPTEPTAL
ncbi:MAG TPA: xylan 1,4-beta-xylosidase [Acidimicrobiia bacterium]|nr:xylan 1,4-beta-xylosidase [Acidimicrobiia bacterium]